MGAQRTSFEKLQRDRDKKAKQALKRERRQTGEPRIGADGLTRVDLGGRRIIKKKEEIIAQIELIHKQLDDKVIDFDEFEERKADLMARLPID